MIDKTSGHRTTRSRRTKTPRHRTIKHKDIEDVEDTENIKNTKDTNGYRTLDIKTPEYEDTEPTKTPGGLEHRGHRSY